MNFLQEHRDEIAADVATAGFYVSPVVPEKSTGRGVVIETDNPYITFDGPGAVVSYKLVLMTGKGTNTVQTTQLDADTAKLIGTLRGNRWHVAKVSAHMTFGDFLGVEVSVNTGTIPTCNLEL